MNCQQICKISRKKGLTEVKIFQKVLGGGYFLKHPVDDGRLYWEVCCIRRRDIAASREARSAISPCVPLSQRLGVTPWLSGT